MAVKKGYKQTEVGVIPEDWEVKPLSDLTKEIGDGIHATPEYVNSSDCFFINGNNLLDGKIVITENTMCVSDVEYRRLRKLLNTDTILMSINGTIGNLAFYDNEKVVLGKSAAYINVNQEASKNFLYYVFQSFATRTYYENELTGTTIRNLSLTSIRNTPISIPPTLAEQESIAEALSDADAFIESIERLLAKKRQIKQGAMSELLTGRRRLSGFGGEWEERKLGDIVEFVNGKPLESMVSSSGDYFIITLDSIDIDGKLKPEHKRSSYFDNSLQKGDIVIILSDLAHGYLLGLCDLIPEDNRYILNQRVGRLRCNNEQVSQFIRMLINRNQDFFRKRGQGTSQRHIYKRDIFELNISLPQKNEQSAIAEILSEMDGEIAALEEKLVKARQVKAGMMGELLGGRIRLNHD